MDEFYKNIKIEKLGDDKFCLSIKVSDTYFQSLILTSQQMEVIIAAYRQAK